VSKSKEYCVYAVCGWTFGYVLVLMVFVSLLFSCHSCKLLFPLLFFFALIFPDSFTLYAAFVFASSHKNQTYPASQKKGEGIF